jgi:hypothetical protein
MPSIRCATFSSVDSSHLSYDDQLDSNTMQYRSKQMDDSSDQLNSQQSFTTCFEKDFSINQSDKQINVVQKRFHSTDMLKDEEKSKEPKHKSGKIVFMSFSNHILCNLDIPSQLIFKSNASSPARKIPKKTFVNKFGKSISNFKSSMSKAFYPHFSSTENIQHAHTIDISSPRPMSQPVECKTSDSNMLTDCLKTLQNEIRILKELIDRKENMLMNITKTSSEERLKYEKENIQLKEQIYQLQIENGQLKARYQSDN